MAGRSVNDIEVFIYGYNLNVPCRRPCLLVCQVAHLALEAAGWGTFSQSTVIAKESEGRLRQSVHFLARYHDTHRQKCCLHSHHKLLNYKVIGNLNVSGNYIAPALKAEDYYLCLKKY